MDVKRRSPIICTEAEVEEAGEDDEDDETMMAMRMAAGRVAEMDSAQRARQPQQPQPQQQSQSRTVPSRVPAGRGAGAEAEAGARSGGWSGRLDAMDTPRDATSSEGDDSPWSARKAAEEAVAARRERRVSP